MLISTLMAVLALSAASTVAGAADRPASRASGEQPLVRWTCGAWHAGSGNVSGYRFCARLSSVTPKVHVENKSVSRARTTHDVTCSRKGSEAARPFGTDLSSHRHAGVIFAKARASIATAVLRDPTDSGNVSMKVHVRKGQWFHCVKGLAGFQLQGTLKKVVCSAQGCSSSRYEHFRGTVTSYSWLETGLGRSFTVRQYLPKA